MAELIGPWIQTGDTSVIDSSAKHPVGTRARDDAGNEYIYLLGVVNTAAGSWVSFDELGVTALLVADAKGRVGVAMAAIGASQYGWYQIYGKNLTAKVLTGFADNGLIYCTSTAGSVDDIEVQGDLVVGAMGRSGVVGGVATVELNYPFVTDVLPGTTA